ncbi:hypothetical protein GCM10007854_13070 [Algimonas porphyrae]|uniref:Uncharacterized protein n=1 Tax=Algimonas porphyrae TaxID=1128113 RepID=A0ABQ5UZS7_9PROT|nr:hypothetical protein GCM10007854_13070 [Algimonas porphyrae]
MLVKHGPQVPDRQAVFGGDLRVVEEVWRWLDGGHYRTPVSDCALAVMALSLLGGARQATAQP